LKPYVQSSFVLLVDFYTGMVYPETIMWKWWELWQITDCTRPEEQEAS
jgi:hypothetical protein